MTRRYFNPHSSESGVYLVLLALGLVAFLALSGFALDGIHAYRVRLQMQKACDAGVVAGLGYRILVGPSADENLVREKTAEVVRRNAEMFGIALSAGELTVTYNKFSEELSATARPDFPLLLMNKIPFGGAGFSNLMKNFGTATGRLNPANVAMVLDSSGSMSCPAGSDPTCACMRSLTGCPATGSKMEQLKVASAAFVERFEGDEFIGTPQQIRRDRISIIPFNIAARLDRSINAQFDPAQWQATISGIQPASNTNPSDGMAVAYKDVLQAVRPTPGTLVMRPLLSNEEISYVYFSDGAPTAARLFLTDTRNQLIQNRPGDTVAPISNRHDYFHYKVIWKVGINEYKGPSALVKAAGLVDITKTDGALPYNYVESDPPADTTPPTGSNPVPPCSRHSFAGVPVALGSIDNLQARIDDTLVGCINSMQAEIPNDSIGSGLVIGSANNPPLERWTEQYYNVTLAWTDFLRRKQNRGTIYTIGLGADDPSPGARAHPLMGAPDPYQSADADFWRKDFFLRRAAQDNFQCTADTCPDFQVHNLSPWDFTTPALGKSRNGEYQFTPNAGELSILFQRIARKILLRLIA